MQYSNSQFRVHEIGLISEYPHIRKKLRYLIAFHTLLILDGFLIVLQEAQGGFLMDKQRIFESFSKAISLCISLSLDEEARTIADIRGLCMMRIALQKQAEEADPLDELACFERDLDDASQFEDRWN